MSLKVIAFELDDTLWDGQLDEVILRSSPNASQKVEDNLEQESERVIRDRNNSLYRITLYPDVPYILRDIRKKGIRIAIISRNSSQALCKRALWYFKAPDEDDHMKPISELITYNEVGRDSKIRAFQQIQGWSGAAFEEMLLFDNDPSTIEKVNEELGVNARLVSRRRGLDWATYQDGLKRKPSDPYDTPFYGLPSLGTYLGKGKFAKVYDSDDDSNAVIKVMEHWVKDLRPRFLEIYRTIEQGKPFKPQDQNSDDQYLLMIAFELRNLSRIGQLKAPDPEKFTGWFTMKKIGGVAVWKTPTYQRHPFSVPFQKLVKTAFHLAVDEIERMVKQYGVEHRDVHLSNVHFAMQDEVPVRGYLLDWGIAVLMKWDGKRFVRGNDVLLWADKAEAGAIYTPEQFRRYWIRWMVKTEYEANMSRGAITEQDGKQFLNDLDWWYGRDT